MEVEKDMIEILNGHKNVNYYICHICSHFNPKKISRIIFKERKISWGILEKVVGYNQMS